MSAAAADGEPEEGRGGEGAADGEEGGDGQGGGGVEGAGSEGVGQDDEGVVGEMDHNIDQQGAAIDIEVAQEGAEE